MLIIPMIIHTAAESIPHAQAHDGQGMKPLCTYGLSLVSLRVPYARAM